MSTTFGILTAVLLLVTAFAAYKNKQAYQNEISHRQKSEQDLASSQETLRKTIENLNATTKELRDTEAEVATLTEKESASKKENDGLKSSIETVKAETESNQSKLDSIKAKLAAIGDINTLVPEVKGIIAAINEAQAQIESDNAKLANLTGENQRIETYIDKIRTEDNLRSKKQSYFTNSRIQAIYPDWGFVTIAAGSAAGVVAGSNLEVVRDGQTVATLLVTAIENNTSQASIVPDSLAEGTVLMTGDKVVPAKAAAPPAKPTPANPAPGLGEEPEAAGEPAGDLPAADDNPFGGSDAAAPAGEGAAPAPPAEADDSSNPFAE
ncbi:MAG: hypothetical protein MUF04_02855 [Akkermansiaceae bacterium]|nr:hypothetical protein [Akkermansiaceae bacterium]